MNSENLRNEIISKIVRIPEENLDSIKDYIDFVIEKGKKKIRILINQNEKKRSKKRKTKSALEKLAGTFNLSGNLAKNIDQ